MRFQRVSQFCQLSLVSFLAFFAAPTSAVAEIAEQDQMLRPAFSGPMVTKAFMIGLTQVGERIFATGQGGIIIYSDDQGQSWTRGEVPIAVTLTAISFADENTGWAVGHDMTILKTVDGGESWQIQNFAPDLDTPLLDVWFRDTNNGYAVGGRGNFMWTTDGGVVWNLKEVWTDDELVPDAHIFTIKPAPNGDLLMVAEVGTLFRSKDMGETWETLESPYRGSFFGVAFPSVDRYIAYAMLGNAGVSVDQGDNWDTLETGVNKSLLTSYITDDGTVVLAGMAGAVVVSEDGGQTFTDRSIEQRVDITGLLPLDNGKWLIACSRGVMEIEI
ncbi:MAG: YCF48-related protein [Gammaproteobacteria bacterium]